MASHAIVGLDIGTAWIKAVVAEVSNGRLIPKHFIKEKSSGLRKGAVIDVSETAPVVARVLHQVRHISKQGLRNMYVSIGTHQSKTQHSRGIVAVSRADSEIYQDDVDRAVKASQAVNLSPNRMIIHNMIREFIVDGVSDISDPLGLSGNRLEVSSLIVDAFVPHVKAIMRVVELASGDIAGLVFGPLAAARSALSKQQKDVGVALIDIGAGTTGLVVYEENKLIGVAKFSVGAGHITNDMGIGLRIPVDTAEQLKLQYGSAIARNVSIKDSVELKKFHEDIKGTVSRRFIAEIVESRLAEIFDFVNNELKLMGKSGSLAGGVVLTGGGAKLPELAELARQELKLSAHIGFPLMDDWEIPSGNVAGEFEDPEFVTALGLILWGADHNRKIRGQGLSGMSIKKIFRYFVP